ILIDRLMEKSKTGNVRLELDHTLDEVLGDKKGVNGIRIRSTKNSNARNLALAGVFIAIGHTPNTQIFQGQVDMVDGYIVTKSGNQGGATATSVPGLFAAGDGAHHVYCHGDHTAGNG